VSEIDIPSEGACTPALTTGLISTTLAVMEIAQAETNRRDRPVLVRLTSKTYDWLSSLSEQAGGGIATTIRSILEAAQKEGVEVSDPDTRKKIRA